jgi:hypothetical protein
MIFHDQEKTEFLLQLKKWSKKDCVFFLSSVMESHNLNDESNSDAALSQYTETLLKSEIIRLIQSIPSVKDLFKNEKIN